MHLAFVFGSLTQGKETAQSDIDLFLEGEITLRETLRALREVVSELGREINPMVYLVAEFKKKVKEGHYLVSELAQGPKIWLIGNNRRA